MPLTHALGPILGAHERGCRRGRGRGRGWSVKAGCWCGTRSACVAWTRMAASPADDFVGESISSSLRPTLVSGTFPSTTTAGLRAPPFAPASPHGRTDPQLRCALSTACQDSTGGDCWREDENQGPWYECAGHYPGAGGLGTGTGNEEYSMTTATVIHNGHRMFGEDAATTFT